ncbi:MAG: tail fiber domain-containing protein, partial [Sedimentisphaerales bacterium]|nr:tail fiber domain-containing protein [Sedimentisphaerales bacterium]
AGQKQIGVVAQEVENVFPEIVASSPAGYKSVDYTKLTAVLIQAVKELKAENDSLRSRLQALEISLDKD